MVPDHYRTLAATVEATIKIERSEFLGIAFPVVTDDDFFGALTPIQKKHFDATHHCWAYRLFAGGEVRARSADAGEPSGTAGKPILQAIEGADLYDTAVVVVRWYGGIKLGTGGLARAYRESAAAALSSAKLLDRYLYTRFELDVPFPMLNAVYRLVRPPDVVLVSEEFGESNVFSLDVRQSQSASFAAALTEKRITWRRVPVTPP